MIKKYRFKYQGSVFWLIFWSVIFFPIGIVLLSQLHFVSQTRDIQWKYEGKRFWLYFWAIFFFPITILLLFFKGFLMVREESLGIGSFSC